MIRGAGRRRRDSSGLESVVYPMGVLAMVGGVVFGVVWLLAERMPDEKPPKPRPVPVEPPLQVADGGGRNPEITRDPQDLEKVAEAGVPALTDRERRVDALLDEALEKIHQTFYAEADRLAQEAIALAPDSRRAKGVWCLGAYVQKYTALADEAIDELDGSCVIDFGGKYGIAGFIERNGDEFKFRCNGQNVPFSRAQLNSIDAVKFRIAARWLDGASLPVNDLILGSVQYMKRLDETGSSRGRDGPWKAAARGRWQKALNAPDAPPTVREHAEWLLSLVDR